MKGILVLALVCLTVGEIFAADVLQCYQCDPVTSECAADKVTAVKCGTSATSKCSKQVKKGSTDDSKAIRKCVVPDGNGNVPCPNGYDCHLCNTELCNAGSVTKFTWISLVGVFFATLYAF